MRRKETSVKHIEREVHLLKEELVERIPSHFSMKHVASATIGALLMGLTFVLTKQLVFDIAPQFTLSHVLLIIAATVVILTGEIYYIGYERVKDKSVRPFFQFWIKRFVAYYLIAVIVSVTLVYVYGFNEFLIRGSDVFKVIIAVSLPAAVGASLADLLKQY